MNRCSRQADSFQESEKGSAEKTDCLENRSSQRGRLPALQSGLTTRLTHPTGHLPDLTRHVSELALRVAVLVCFLVPVEAHGQQTVVAGPNVWVSRDNAEVVQVEAVIAVDPTDPGRMVIAAIGLRRPHASDWQDHQTILIYHSEDGGASWVNRTVTALPEAWTAGDPWLAWLPEEGLLLSAIAGEALTRRGDPPARARLFFSPDGGQTWDDRDRTPFLPGSSEDHPVLAVGRDRTGGTKVFSVATHATMQYEGVDAALVQIPSLEAEPVPSFRPIREQVNLGGAVVLPGGDLVISYYSMRPPRSLWSSRRDSMTETWSETRIRDSILPVGFPALALDMSTGPHAGRIYSVWVEAADLAGHRVLLAWSDDGGGSWSSPTRVNADRNRVSRTLPAVAVAPGGAVAVVWQDQRNAGGRACTDLYGTVSENGGATFLPEVRVSSVTACMGGEDNGAAAGRFRLGGGDYQSVTATGRGTFQVAWSDSRTGRFQLWTARLAVR